MSDTDCGRLISVLAFYVFSCSCLHGSQTRKPSREARNESQLLWREEIESGPTPSFLRNNTRQPSRGSSRVNSKCSRISTPSSKATSQFSLPVIPGAEPQPLERLVSRVEKQRITTVTVSELPKIHPPINDRHPPVVSALPESRKATAWMMLPPPPARAMRAINRATHIRKTSQRDGIGNPHLDTRLADLEEGPVVLGNSPEEPIAVSLEEIEEKSGVGDEGYRAGSAASSSTMVREMTKGWPHDMLSPTINIHTGAEYECYYFDPNSGATRTCTLSYDEDFRYQTAPPPPAPAFMEVIQRPPPVFKKPCSPPQNLDGFEDIYG